MNKTRIVIIGGTSAIAVQCARIWVQQDPIDLTLIGRDTARLKKIADDLEIRSPDSFINVLEADFLEPQSIKSVSQKIIENGNVDIVLIAQGALIEQESSFGVVESVKTVSDLYAPVSGTITAVNKDLETHPEQVNDEPYGKGWIIKIELTDENELKNLMSPEVYSDQCSKEQT